MSQKQKSLRDRKWLDHVRNHCRCLVTGRLGHSEVETIDPAHIGTGGKGLKSPDNEVIPLLHSVHLRCHQQGEIPVLRREIPSAVWDEVIRKWLATKDEDSRTIINNVLRSGMQLPTRDLREALRAYARREYLRWQNGLRPFDIERF